MEKNLCGYDTYIILNSEVSTEALANLKSRTEGIVQQFDGEIVTWEDQGKKRFAYRIHGETKGHYIRVVYNATSGVVAELERTLRINESVVRFLTISLGRDFTRDRLSERLATALKKMEEREKEAQKYAESTGGYGRMGDDEQGSVGKDGKDDKKLMSSRPNRKKVRRMDIDKRNGLNPLDYRDLNLLRSFVSEHGRLVPRRITGVSSYSQRKIATAIKRAREMALLPYMS